MNIKGIRLEIEDNIDAAWKEGITIAKLVEFLLELPQEATIVWGGVNKKPLIIVCPKPYTGYCYITEAE